MKLKTDEKHLLKRITYNPSVFGGKPIIRNYRIAVEHIIGMLAAGSSIEELLEGYPFLEKADIQACLLYAHRLATHERTEPLLVKETHAVYKLDNKSKTIVNKIKKGLNTLEFHVLVEKEGKLYSALCLELNVASQGRTLIEANKNIREAITLYLEDVYDAKDEKSFVPRPAPVSEWLKFFKQDAENLKAVIRSRNLKPRYKEVVVG
ncbi:MAG: DUF433 domain-containing protein [Candidatus Aminicenantes bacterium]|nr:DUF433 domain-containing protein [Candidatus Aminicenantes bacterium]